MICKYCGKTFDEGKGASIYSHGELIAEYCSASCMGKTFKKAAKIIKKMTGAKTTEKRKSPKKTKR